MVDRTIFSAPFWCCPNCDEGVKSTSTESGEYDIFKSYMLVWETGSETEKVMKCVARVFSTYKPGTEFEYGVKVIRSVVYIRWRVSSNRPWRSWRTGKI